MKQARSMHRLEPQTFRHLEGVSIIASAAPTKLRDGELVAVDAHRGSAYEGEIAVIGRETGSGGGPAPLGGGATATVTQLLIRPMAG